MAEPFDDLIVPPSISKRSLKKGGEAGDVIRQMLVEALRTAAVPGQALQGRFGHEPAVPGQWSEEDEAIAGANQGRMYNAARDTAMNVVGAPGTPKGALGAGARNPDLLHGISKIKLPRPLAEMKHGYSDIAPSAERVITPEALQGGVLLPAIGDRTMAGRKLTSVHGKELETPVDLLGGHGFMAANEAGDRAWASGKSVISRIAKQAERAGEKGDPVYFPYTAMGERSSDFSHHVAQPLAQLLRANPLEPAIAKKFDEVMGVSRGKGAGGVADWPGIGDPSLADYLARAPGAKSARFAKELDKAWVQQAGAPSVAEVRHAVTDPRLLDVPTGASGLSISKLEPGLPMITKGQTGHPSYYKGGKGAELPGRYIGGFGTSVPKEVMFPDMIKAYADMGYSPARYDYLMARGVKGAPASQRADQRWLDGVMQWLQANPVAR